MIFSKPAFLQYSFFCSSSFCSLPRSSTMSSIILMIFSKPAFLPASASCMRAATWALAQERLHALLVGHLGVHLEQGLLHKGRRRQGLLEEVQGVVVVEDLDRGADRLELLRAHLLEQAIMLSRQKFTQVMVA